MLILARTKEKKKWYAEELQRAVALTSLVGKSMECGVYYKLYLDILLIWILLSDPTSGVCIPTGQSLVPRQNIHYLSGLLFRKLLIL